MTDDELLHVYACHCWRCRDTRERLNQVYHLFYRGRSGGWDGRSTQPQSDDPLGSRYDSTRAILRAIRIAEAAVEAAGRRLGGSVSLCEPEGQHLRHAESIRRRTPTIHRARRDGGMVRL